MTKPHPPTRRTPASSEKKLLFPLLAVLILAALAALLWISRSAFPRLEVGGFRIGREEYLRAMYQARNDVLSDHAAISHSLTDWSTATPLGDPRELTMERALEILTESYAVDTLAVERGYLSEAGFEAMQRDMEDINRQRQEALDSGAVITGFSSFTMDDYISYRASNIRLQFCNDTDNPEYPVTQEELLARYEADRDNLYQQPDDLELEYLVIPSDPELEMQLQALRRAALETGSLSAALEEQPQLQEYYQEISVNSATYSSYSRSHSDILAYSEDLATGELSQVINLDGWLCLIRCRQRIDRDYVPLEDVQSIVEQSIRESRYDALIAERMEAMEITGNLQALYRFTAEQLP